MAQTTTEDLSVEPSAPPPLTSRGAPPSYDSVAHQASNRTRNAGNGVTGSLTASLQFAGASIGRWFGVHDDQLVGWPRTGTLPGNSRTAGYSIIPQDELTHAATLPMETGTGPSSSRRPPNGDMGNRESDPEQAPRSRGRRRARRLVSTFIGRGRAQNAGAQTPEEVKKTLPTFWPVMTVLITVVEVALLVATMVYFGVAPIALRPKQETELVVGFNNYTTTVTREIAPNFFIGPSSEALVHTGAMYTPCMRENIEFLIEAAKGLVAEKNLRCCKGSLGECGVQPFEECKGFYRGEVLGGASVCLAELNATNATAPACTRVTLHPCCIGLLGTCIITSKENCTFQQGYWHPDKVLCSELGTGCFNDICRFTWMNRTIGQQPSQALRFVTALFLYQGVVHFILINLFKFYESWKIEKRIGWLRLFCVYLLSSIGGFVVSGIFDPKAVSVGGSGGLFGLFGILFVEILQSWKMVKRPCVEIVKLLALVIFLLLLGTLPYIDNYSQIGGFVFGVLSSFIFVPYITIGKWDRAKKLCLLLTAVPIILFLFLLGFIVFYNTSNPDFCPKCSYINCIPYTSTFCDDFITTLLSVIPGVPN